MPAVTKSSRTKKANSRRSRQSRKLPREALEKVAEIFRALSEPTRLAILQELKSGSKSVGELVAELDTSQANVSKQLKLLFDAQLLSRQKEGNLVFYSISDPMVMELCALVCGKLNRQAESANAFIYEI